MKKKVLDLFNFMKLHRIKIVLILDFISVPLLFFFKWMASSMLSGGKSCMIAEAGLQCFTCGGTRCVNFFLNGNFIEAFRMNQFIFLLIILMTAVFILVNFYVLFDAAFAKKALKKIFSIPGLVIFLVLAVGFYVGRNIDNVVDLIRLMGENADNVTIQ